MFCEDAVCELNVWGCNNHSATRREMGTARGGDRAEDGPGSLVASLTVPIALESLTSAFFVKETIHVLTD